MTDLSEARKIAFRQAARKDLKSYFVYSTECDGLYVRKCDDGCTEAETLRKDFECYHDGESKDDGGTGECDCMEQCEMAVRLSKGEVGWKSLRALRKEHGTLIWED